MNKNLFVIIGILFCILNVNADISVNSCPVTLSTDGATYYLTTDITTIGSCYSIHGNDITFDCKGHSINGDLSGSDSAFYLSHSANDFTLKNCFINGFSTQLDIIGTSFYTTDFVIYNNSFSHFSTRSIANNYGLGTYIIGNIFNDTQTINSDFIVNGLRNWSSSGNHFIIAENIFINAKKMTCDGQVANLKPIEFIDNIMINSTNAFHYTECNDAVNGIVFNTSTISSSQNVLEYWSAGDKIVDFNFTHSIGWSGNSWASDYTNGDLYGYCLSCDDVNYDGICDTPQEIYGSTGVLFGYDYRPIPCFDNGATSPYVYENVTTGCPFSINYTSTELSIFDFLNFANTSRDISDEFDMKLTYDYDFCANLEYRDTPICCNKDFDGVGDTFDLYEALTVGVSFARKQIADLSWGCYKVELSNNDFGIYPVDSIYDISSSELSDYSMYCYCDLTGGGKLYYVDERVTAADISGTIYGCSDLNCVALNNWSVLSGATVTVIGTSKTFVGTDTSDANGLFEVNDVITDMEYTIKVSKSGYNTFSSNNYIYLHDVEYNQIHLVPNQVLSNKNFSISGEVTAKVSGEVIAYMPMKLTYHTKTTAGYIPKVINFITNDDGEYNVSFQTNEPQSVILSANPGLALEQYAGNDYDISILWNTLSYVKDIQLEKFYIHWNYGIWLYSSQCATSSDVSDCFIRSFNVTCNSLECENLSYIGTNGIAKINSLSCGRLDLSISSSYFGSIKHTTYLSCDMDVWAKYYPSYTIIEKIPVDMYKDYSSGIIGVYKFNNVTLESTKYTEPFPNINVKLSTRTMSATGIVSQVVSMKSTNNLGIVDFQYLNNTDYYVTLYRGSTQLCIYTDIDETSCVDSISLEAPFKQDLFLNIDKLDSKTAVEEKVDAGVLDLIDFVATNIFSMLKMIFLMFFVYLFMAWVKAL